MMCISSNLIRGKTSSNLTVWIERGEEVGAERKLITRTIHTTFRIGVTNVRLVSLSRSKAARKMYHQQWPPT